MAVGKNITCKKRERGSNIICPIILRLLGRISSGDEGKGTKTKIKKNWVGKNIKFQGTLYSPGSDACILMDITSSICIIGKIIKANCLYFYFRKYSRVELNSDLFSYSAGAR